MSFFFQVTDLVEVFRQPKKHYTNLQSHINVVYFTLFWHF